MQLSLIANSSTQTFTFSLAGLLAETTRQELANFAAALGGSGRGDEDAALVPATSPSAGTSAASR